MITSNGIVMRTTVEGVSKMGRSTRGVRVVNLQDGDTVAALAVLNQDDLERPVAADDPDASTSGENTAMVNGSDASAPADVAEEEPTSDSADAPEAEATAEA